MGEALRLVIPRREADVMKLPLVVPERDLRATADYPLRTFPEGLINPGVLLPAIRRVGDQPVDGTVFISRRRAGLSEKQNRELAKFNQQAFDLARRAPGYRTYWQGEQITDPDAQQRDFDPGLPFRPDCYSFCLWDSRAEAQAGSQTAAHLKAVEKVGEWYEAYAIQKVELTVRDTRTGTEITVKDNGIHTLINAA